MSTFLLEEVTLTYEHLQAYYLVIISIEGYVLITLSNILAMMFEEYSPITWIILNSIGGVLNIISGVYLFKHRSDMNQLRVRGMNKQNVDSIYALTFICGLIMILDSGWLLYKLVRKTPPKDEAR